MKNISSLILLLTLLCLLRPGLQAEGVKQATNNDPATNVVMLQVNDPAWNNFAGVNAEPTSRMYFSIADATETVRVGLSRGFSSNGETVAGNYYFRIKNAAGVVVSGPTLVNAINAIDTESDLNTFPNDPDKVALSLSGLAAGDYYIEFNDQMGFTSFGVIYIKYWEVVVTDAGGVEKTGRLWAQNWSLRTPRIDYTGSDDAECVFDRPYNGRFYSYTDDGFVSLVNLSDSGFQGLTFSVAFNASGPGNENLSLEDRRKSIAAVGSSPDLGPQYKVFFNEPDIDLFPSGACGQLVEGGTGTSFRCEGDSLCFPVEVSLPGQVELIIDFGRNGTDTTDVSLVQLFSPTSLMQDICWDGLKGDGTPILFTDEFDLIIRYSQGVQHWAKYDVEFLKEGFSIETIRPMNCGASATDQLYWDDTNILPDTTGYPASLVPVSKLQASTLFERKWNNFTLGPQGCAGSNLDGSTNGFGDKNIINTWWFANVSDTIFAPFPFLLTQIEGDTLICPGGTGMLAANTTYDNVFTDLSFTWSGPGNIITNTTGDTVTIDMEGTYYVTVETPDGCTAVDSFDVLLFNDTPIVMADPNDVVDASCAVGNDGSFVATAANGLPPYTFSVGDSLSNNDGIFENIAAGTYQVLVTDTNGCTDTTDVTVGIRELPFDPTDSIPDLIPACIGDVIGLNPDFSPGPDHTFNWAPADDLSSATAINPTITVTTDQTFYVTVTVGSGADVCTVEDSVMVTAISNPVPSFTTHVDCDGLTVAFTNTTTPGADAYSWDFGDLTTNMDVSDAENPTYTYPGFGTYTITLTATNGGICAASTTQEITLIPFELDANFDYCYTTCDSEAVEVQFTDMSLATPQTIDSWMWDFGNGQTSTDQNPVLTFTADATLNVQLKVTTTENCMDSITMPVVIDILDSLFNGVIDPETGEEFEFPDTLKICRGDTAMIMPMLNEDYNYTWSPTNSLSDANAANPKFFPTETTTYSVTITTNGDSCQVCEITEELVIVVPPPINPGITSTEVTDLNLGGQPNIVCVTPVTLNANAEVPATYVWTDENDVVLGTGESLTIDVPGTVNVFLTATDECGCTETVQCVLENSVVDVDVQNLINVCLNDVDPNDPLTITTTNNVPGDTLTYNWSPDSLFVPGTEDDAQPVLVDGLVGNLTAYVTIINQDMCTQEDSTQISIVDPGIDLDFGIDTMVCSGVSYTFSNLSTGMLDGVVFQWNFGDGTIITSNNMDDVAHVYNDDNAAFQITLSILNDSTGCVDPVSRSITTFPVEDIDITVTDVTGGGSVAVENDTLKSCGAPIDLMASTNVVVNGIDWVIVGTTDTITGEDFTYTGTGGEQIMITADDEFGCQDTLILTVIDARVNIDLTVEFEDGSSIPIGGDTTICVCPMDIVDLVIGNNSPDQTLTFDWSPDDVIVGGGDGNNTASVMVNDSIVVSALIDNGCCDTTVQVTFIVNTPSIEIGEDVDGDGVFDFTSDSIKLCEDNVALTTNVDAINGTVTWTNAAGAPIGSGGDITYNVGPMNDYVVATVTDDKGCQATDTLFITNMQLDFDLTFTSTGTGTPIAITNDTTICVCPMDMLDFAITNNNPEQTLIGTWQFDGQPFDVGAMTTVTVDEDGGVLTAIIDNGCCSDTLEITIITNNPSIEIGEDLDMDGTFNFMSDSIKLCEANVPLTTNVDAINGTIVWTNAAGMEIGSGGDITYNAGVTNDFVVATVTDEKGCQAMDTLYISNVQLDFTYTVTTQTLGNPFEVTGDTTIFVCPNEVVDLNIANNDPDMPITVNWVSDGNITVDGNSATVIVSGDGDVITAEITNGCCDETIVVTITTTNPTIEIGEDLNADGEFDFTTTSIELCEDNVALTTMVEAMMGTIVWTNAVGDTISSGGDLTYTGGPFNDFVVATVTDQNGCTATDTLFITNSQLDFTFEVTIGDTEPVIIDAAGTTLMACEGAPVNLNIVNNDTDLDITVTWTPDGPNVVAGNEPVTYTAAISNGICDTTVSVTIDPIVFDLDLPAEVTTCGENVTLTASHPLGFTIQWTDQDGNNLGTQPSISVDPSEVSSVNWVAVTNDGMCEDAGMVIIINNDIIDPLVGTADPDEIFLNESSTLTVTGCISGGCTYEWLNNTDHLSATTGESVVSTPTETGVFTYQVAVTQNGCTEIVEITLTVLPAICDEDHVYLPNAFTPNGDGQNDVLQIRSNFIDQIEIVEFMIYSRWGEEIYRSKDPFGGWDGTFQGEQLPPDVYGFYLHVRCPDETDLIQKGNITLIR